VLSIGALAAAASVAQTAHAQCKADADCRAGRVCRDGACAEAGCTKDTDCPGDAVCRAGVCGTAAGPSAPAPSYVPPPLFGPTPVRYESERTGIKGLYIAGPILLGVAYFAGISVTAGVTTDEDRGKHIGIMAIPILGPWIMIPQSTNDHSYDGALVAAGVAQAAGLTMTILGLAIRTEKRVPVYGLVLPKTNVAVAPGVVGRTGVGLQLTLPAL
jgi:hypothetical protein